LQYIITSLKDLQGDIPALEAFAALPCAQEAGVSTCTFYIYKVIRSTDYQRLELSVMDTYAFGQKFASSDATFSSAEAKVKGDNILERLNAMDNNTARRAHIYEAEINRLRAENERLNLLVKQGKGAMGHRILFPVSSSSSSLSSSPSPSPSSSSPSSALALRSYAQSDPLSALSSITPNNEVRLIKNGLFDHILVLFPFLF